VLAVAALLAAVAVLGAQRTAPPVALAVPGDFAGLVEIGGGRRLYLECRGTGGPTVVLVAGGLNTGGAWTILPEEVAPPAVLPGVASFTRVCAYDRPGTLLDAAPPDDQSRSDPIPQPTTAEAMVADLHALLQAARVPGPYVLAGHSFGGLLARLYASTYPEEVVGMVLVDAYGEGVRAAMTPEQWAIWLATNPGPLPPELAAIPTIERFDINDATDTLVAVVAARPLRPMPLAVLSAGHTGALTPEEAAAFPPGYPDALLAANRAGHAFNAALLPDARHVFVADSGHYIQAEQPALVIDAIRQVVEAVRDPSSWAPAPTDVAVPGPVAVGGGRRTEEQYTAIVQAVPSPPRWFKGADDRFHLAYELLLTNTIPLPVTVRAVEVLDAGRGTAVTTLRDEALSAALSLLTGDDLPAATLPPSTVAVVWFDLSFAGPTAIPATVEHRVTLGLPPGLSVPATITATGGRAEVDRRPPVVLGPPLLGPHWVAAGSCCDGPHRRALQAINSRLHLSQRFAIDFNLLDAEGRIAVTPLSVNTNHAGYGQPVLAVADATVVAAVDGIPDQIEGEHYLITAETAPGNHVVLDLGAGRFAFYAHLRPGTLAVRSGERVHQGQHLGELGNSGSSHGAHLHFQVMDGPSPLAADGLPYVFDAFELTGHAPPLAELAARYEAGLPLPIDSRGAGPRRDALPLGGDVVAFSGQTGGR
jgi:pimeloyl-ACP methyl ester carboxylesterase